ncbi:TIGR03560 family F420-dependent LLM class oxidoreductase [Oscillochloris sp. ZM17-4]|uniref:TIGR03560 family F420-dependent LLM class oxidoreductase n=1 Tax=Oscillochloris sp. ZM17-4 TaxID=2866714 RepID=UPI001C73CA9C|nr:TIGR03560 family F420-dependent LLM class oxidoreductase [Oscillochloris sp. ZM17-4]MBX0326522.1 TIGR03560 family F420-dependent LLM class oxidoreductase [Oscillochloris sp. ZM17-4]
MDVALMIEGQNGLTWPRWQRLAQAAEGLGFAGLYRSDHYTNAGPPDRESLELWLSLTWLASHTSRIAFGPIVSPVSFRHPAMTARYAAGVDDLAGGRLQLGLGAGWQEREHTNFGMDLLEVGPRFARFTEGLEVITRLLKSDEPVSFAGEYYQLREAILLPRPQRPGGPPIIIGGNGPRRTLPLVAQYADEWNAVFIPPARFAELSAQLDALLSARGRAPASLRRSLMTGSAFGRDEAEVAAQLAGRDRADLVGRGVLVGTAGEVVEQLGRIAEAGVQRVMVQWLGLDDLDRLESFAAQVLPQIAPGAPA